MTRLVQAAEVNALPPGGRVHIDLEYDSVIVLNVDGQYYCIADLCTHDGGPLEDGVLDGVAIECPRHGARFDVRDGSVLCLPASAPIPTFDVVVIDDIIFVVEPEYDY